jgi:2,4-dienoyl-CoA reductase-like NADH-dependent reductase (Old Yellow Enzyme family)/thioredoxin reductase
MEFKNLFSPIRIGSIEIGNRIALAPMANYMSNDRGEMTQPQIDFMEARARGGAGLLIMGSIYVQHPVARFGVGQLGLYDDSLLPGYVELVKAVKRHGSKIAAQLHHAGRQTTRAAIQGRQPVAPSPIACGGKYSDEPRELSVAEIGEIIEAYAATARRCVEAGFDAIELHCAHGYLPCEFMSPFSNRRSDEYGGDLNGRMRFPLELLARIKEVAGDLPVWCRIIGSELVEGGLDIEDMKVIAKILADAGADAISVSRGIAPYYWTVSNYYFPPGYSVHYAEAIKAGLDVPVMTAGRITTPAQAEQILVDGRADIINLGRALIADPDWPQKAAAGQVDDIMPCISCNKGCHDPKKKVRHTICLVNAQAGREVEFEIEPAARPKKVMIVGGGPAGLEAARIASLRGHQVTLYEAESQWGGRWRLGSQVPCKEHFIELVDYLGRQAIKHGAQIELDHSVSAQDVQAAAPDVLIVAAGAKPVVPPIPGVDQDFVVTSDDVLAGRAQVGGKVVVVGGGSCGAETADWMVRRGVQVTIVEMLDLFCPDMLPDAQYLLEERLAEAGVTILLGTKVEEIRDHAVVVSRADPALAGGWHGSIENVDAVVLAVGAKPNREVVQQLEGLAPEFYAIGDCVQPGFAIDAIYEGAKIAREI